MSATLDERELFGSARYETSHSVSYALQRMMLANGEGSRSSIAHSP